MSEANLNQVALESEIAKDDGKPKVLDFYATWCGPCHMLKPTVDKTEDDCQGKVDFYKLDVEDEQNANLMQKYGITGFPTVIILDKDGKEVAHAVGLIDAKQALEDLDKKEGSAFSAKPGEKLVPEGIEAKPENNMAQFKETMKEMINSACLFGACIMKSKSDNIARGLAIHDDKERVKRWHRYTHVNVFDYAQTPEMTGFPPTLIPKLLKLDPNYLHKIEKTAIDKFNMPLTKEDLKHKH